MIGCRVTRAYRRLEDGPATAREDVVLAIASASRWPLVRPPNISEPHRTTRQNHVEVAVEIRTDRHHCASRDVSVSHRRIVVRSSMSSTKQMRKRALSGTGRCLVGVDGYSLSTTPLLAKSMACRIIAASSDPADDTPFDATRAADQPK